MQIMLTPKGVKGVQGVNSESGTFLPMCLCQSQPQVENYPNLHVRLTARHAICLQFDISQCPGNKSRTKP
jgi:hypothetical protein